MYPGTVSILYDRSLYMRTVILSRARLRGNAYSLGGVASDQQGGVLFIYASGGKPHSDAMPLRISSSNTGVVCKDSFDSTEPAEPTE